MRFQLPANACFTNMPEYAVYMGAKRRCIDPNRKEYEDYGGRGIEFLFVSFEEFFGELGPRPPGVMKCKRRLALYSLDRYPNQDGHYEPGNVRWATPKEQGANKRSRRWRHNPA